MKKAVVLGCTLAAVSGFANATLLNGSFETGDFSGWNVNAVNGGDNAVVTGHLGVAATEGDFFASLTADSTLSQDFSWGLGDTLSFDWNFAAKDFMPYNDYSVFTITEENQGVVVEITLADVMSTGSFNTTGWNTFVYDFNSAGTGSVEFSVYNTWGAGLDSQLYIDNVLTASPDILPPPLPIPESGTLVLLALSAVGLFVSRRQVKKA